MKRRTKVILSIIIILLTLTIGGVIWQWQNIRAVIESTKYSKEELAMQIDNQKADLEGVLKEYGLDSVMDFTFEEEEAIRRGEMSYEEAVEQLEQRRQQTLSGAGGTEMEQASDLSSDSTTGEKQNSSSNSGNGNSAVQGETSQQEDASAVKAKTEQAVSEMYSLKAKYIGELGKLERAARSDYSALSSEQKKNGGIRSLVSKYMSPGLSLQSQCDAEVNTVINNLQSYLKANGQSTEIIPVMKAAYEREKELKKAYYLSLVQ